MIKGRATRYGAVLRNDCAQGVFRARQCTCVNYVRQWEILCYEVMGGAIYVVLSVVNGAESER